MNIDPNDIDEELGALKGKARAFSESPLGKQVVAGVENIAREKLRDVKRSAAKSGMGGALDVAVNLAEDKTGIDLDGDGDVGK
jgi:hypothetical protein